MNAPKVTNATPMHIAIILLGPILALVTPTMKETDCNAQVLIKIQILDYK